MSTTRRVGGAPGMMPRLKALPGQALASVREARRPKPSRRHPDDEWYTDDWRKQEINERQRDERSWLRRPRPRVAHASRAPLVVMPCVKAGRG